MKKVYKIVITGAQDYREFGMTEGESYTVGTEAGVDFRLNPCLYAAEVRVTVYPGEPWRARCSGDSVFLGNSGEPCMDVSLSEAEAVSLYHRHSGQKLLSLRCFCDYEQVTPKLTKKLRLEGIRRIGIGSEEACQIRLTSSASSGNRLQLMREETEWKLMVLQHDSAVFLNGEMVDAGAPFPDYAWLNTADFFACRLSDELFFTGDSAACASSLDVSFPDSYPRIQRTPPFCPGITEDEIRILPPPNEEAPPEKTFLLSLLPALLMPMFLLLLSRMLNFSGNGMMVFIICSSGVTFLVSVLNFLVRGIRYRKKKKERETRYREYLQEMGSRLRIQADAEKAAYLKAFPPLCENLRISDSFSGRLWDRRFFSSSFLTIRIGTGTISSKRRIRIPEENPLSDRGSKKTAEANEIRNLCAYRFLPEAPVCLNLTKETPLGICGSSSAQERFLKSLLLEIICHTDPSDCRISIVSADAEAVNPYHMFRFLPHLKEGTHGRRFRIGMEDANRYLRELTNRASVHGEEGSETETVSELVFLIQAEKLDLSWLSEQAEQFLSARIYPVICTASEANIPAGVRREIRLNGTGGGEVFTPGQEGEIQTFSADDVPEEGLFEARLSGAVRMIEPVRVRETQTMQVIPKQITLYELFQVYRAEELEILTRYETGDITKEIRLPLGVNGRGEIVSLDLHEKGHGPHGLVAGTTGSGKSELLQTIVLSGALTYSPEELGFLLVDFKGGGMGNALSGLPHVRGCITNLDGDGIARSLLAIRAEILRREKLFSEVSVHRIDDYIRKHRQGKLSEALPHLLIIVDEFAELRTAYPDFMKELISTARVGRSLGIHLILATQKPSGQVSDQIWSNSRFRICLKVQSTEDSREVLHSSEAAYLVDPGRAILQVGNGEVFEEIQTAYSGAQRRQGARGIRISALDLSGTAKSLSETPEEERFYGKTQLQEVVDYIRNCCEEAGLSAVRPVFLPELPAVLPLADPALGLLDYPEEQRQRPMELSDLPGNIFIAGGSGSGKTQALAVLTWSLCMTHSPEAVSVYILSEGDQLLSALSALPQVGDVCAFRDGDSVRYLLIFLKKELERRKKPEEYGRPSEADSCKGTDFPAIFLLVDHWSVFSEAEETREILELLLQQGPAYGIRTAATECDLRKITYRTLSFFSSRICFHPDDRSDYSMFLGKSGLSVSDIPGRFLSGERSGYAKGQFYRIPGTDTEAQIRFIREGAEKLEMKYPGRRAPEVQRIPDSPRYAEFQDTERFPEPVLGYSYEDAEPVSFSFFEEGILGVTGREHAGMRAFLKLLIQEMKVRGQVSEVYLFDRPGDGIDSYDSSEAGIRGDCEAVWSCMADRLTEELSERLSGLKRGLQMKENDGLLILIRSEEALEYLDTRKALLKYLRKIPGTLRRAGVYLLISEFPDEPVQYQSPDLLKLIKERRKILFFESPDRWNLSDRPLNQKKRDEPFRAGDAYFLNGNTVTKLRLLRTEPAQETVRKRRTEPGDGTEYK